MGNTNHGIGITALKQVVIPETLEKKYNFFVEPSGDVSMISKSSQEPIPTDWFQFQRCTCFNEEANDGVCNGGCT